MAITSKDEKETNPVKEYIKETDSVSRPTAVFFTIIIFVLGAAVAFSLFWGGRWVYDRVAGNDSKQDTVTETSSQSTQKADGNKAANTNGSSTSSQNSVSTGTSTQTTGSGSSASATPATGPSETPNTGPTEVPNTGPMPE